MKTAKEIKTQAATVRRTVTSIRNIIEINKFYKRIESGHLVLSDKDIEQLERSTAILSKLSAKTASAAVNALTQEAAKVRAIEKASAEATYILGEWPVASSVLDKTAFIIGNHDIYALQHRLKYDGINYTNEFKCLFEDALRNLPINAAYHAVQSDKSIVEVMAEAGRKLIQIKSMATTQELANLWQNKMV